MKRSRLLSLLVLVALLLASAPAPAQAASLPSALQFTLITGGLTSPVFITHAGDGSNRLFIVQQTGQIRIFKNGGLLGTAFLNIASLPGFTNAGSEQGLLGLAFAPDYPTSGIFYITYTTTTGNATFPYSTTLARYHVSGSADQADAASRTVLLTISKKYTNHNGGMLAFGPDGFLYMSMGDGGSGGDPDNNAQNLHTLLGKLIRIDVTSTPPAGKPYVIPASNPFSGSGDPALRQEIWAYGLRNPWRFSFDRGTNDLYIADVGQDTEEEVDFQAAGAAGGQNYGWRILEGNLCYPPGASCSPPAGYVGPVATYDHGTNDSYGCSITGGYAYRGNMFPSLQGVYFYGDFCSGKVLALVRNAGTWSHALIASTPYAISSFGEDQQGELYLADYSGGRIYRVGSPCSSAIIDVRIQGALQVSSCVPPGSSGQASYNSTNGGPVAVRSADGVTPILASERVILSAGGRPTGFTEMMGLPNSQLDTTYWLPWYNNVDLDTQLRFGNAGGSGASVRVFIGGAEMPGSPFPLGAGESTRQSFAGINGGPVKIVSNVPIVAAERVILLVNGARASFSEMMALPGRQLDTTYWLPWYNNADLDTALRFGNVSALPAHVRVFIGGSEMPGSPFALDVGQSERVSFAGVNSGPVQIVSDVPVVAAERVILSINGTRTSFSEMMGLPDGQLGTTYWMPLYNNVDLDTALRFGNVSASPAHVHVTIGGSEMPGSPFLLGIGESMRQSFAGINAGPVKIVSDVPIVAAERVIYSASGVRTSFSEMMGLPASQLDTFFWLPWYNNVDLNTQLRLGVP